MVGHRDPALHKIYEIHLIYHTIRRKLSMTFSKLSFCFMLLTIITIGIFSVGLEAQDTENEISSVQEFINRAKLFVRRNQFEEAIEIYKRIVMAAPDDYDSRTELALLYSRTNQHESAAQAYSKLLEFDSENVTYQDGLVSSLQAAGKYNEALDHAQSFIKTYPTVGVHYARLARLYEIQGNEHAAIVNYNKAIELEHNKNQTFLNLARLNFLNENIDAAEFALKNAILTATSASERRKIERQLISFYRYHGNLEEKLKIAEDDGTITFEMQVARAEYYNKNGELEKAVSAYNRALNLTTSSTEIDRISAELLKVYVQLNDIDSVIAPYETEVNSYIESRIGSYISERITTTSAKIAVIYNFETVRDALIDAFKSQNKLEVLKTHYEGQLTQNRENPVAQIILARIYWDERDYQKSAEMYEALGKAESNNVRYFYYAAAALKRNKQPELANEMLNQAKHALASYDEKDVAWFLGSLATICIENRMFEPALELSKSALEKSDSDTNIRIQDVLRNILAKSYRETKRYTEAYEIYQESESQLWAKNAIREIAKEVKLYEKWITEQQKKVEMNPNDPKLIEALAQSYETTDKIEEAIKQYQKLTKIQPENSHWYRKLGDLYQKVDLEIDEVIESHALSLDGDGSYVEIVDSEILNNITEQVTISAWIKLTDFPNTCTTVLFKGNKRTPNLTHRQFALWVFDEGYVYFDASPNGRFIRWIASDSESIQRNEWYHVAATIDARNDSVKLYLNGAEIRRSNFKGENNLTKTTLPLRIGCSHEEEISEHASYAGLIDEVRIWNIVRTENQIRSDMRKQLKGNEAGLVGYWKFDAETEGRVLDTSLNKNDGKLVGNAKLEPYSRPIFASSKVENLTKAAAYYEKAIELRPTTFHYYDRLAKVYIDQNLISDAAYIYLRAFDADIGLTTRETIISTISELYADEGQEGKLIAILEEVEPKMQENIILHELLGDLYKKTGDPDKAELAYAKWLKLREQEVNIQNANRQRWFAEELLDKGIFPETTLKFAKRALHDNTETSYHYSLTLGHAYLANDLYDEALRNYKYALSIINANSSLDSFWKQIAVASKNANDKERYKQMLDALKKSIPPEYASSKQTFAN